MPHTVTAEIRKAGLTPEEATRLSNLMGRFSTGGTLPKDHKRLRDGVQELRLDGHHRIFRLYFGRIESGLVLLALHFNNKKGSDRPAIDLAAERLKRWRDLPDQV